MQSISSSAAIEVAIGETESNPFADRGNRISIGTKGNRAGLNSVIVLALVLSAGFADFARAQPPGYPRPTSCFPTTVDLYGPTFQLTVTGVNFQPGDQVTFGAAAVHFSGGPPVPTVYVNSTTLIATIDAAQIGSPQGPWHTRNGTYVGVERQSLGPQAYPTLGLFSLCLPEAITANITPKYIRSGIVAQRVEISGANFAGNDRELIIAGGVSGFVPAILTFGASLNELSAFLPTNLLTTPRTLSAYVEINGAGNYINCSAPSPPPSRAVDVYILEEPDNFKVMITEVSWGSQQWIEITNFEQVTRSLLGLSIRWEDGSNVVTHPLSQTLQPKESFIVHSPSAAAAIPPFTQTLRVNQLQPGAPGDAFAVSLLDTNSAVLDSVNATSISGTFSVSTTADWCRGAVSRLGASANSGSIERIWGYDSGGASDWTLQAVSSPGLENRNSGRRGIDPVPVRAVRINEVTTSPTYIEFVNLSGDWVNMKGWTLVVSGVQGSTQATYSPWASDTAIPDGAYFVIGTTAARPAELPLGGIYQPTAPAGVLGDDEYSMALYDMSGQLVDLVRTTGHDDVVVHNQPRAPGHWSDFVGAAPRGNGSGADTIGRIDPTIDTNSGADWRPVQSRSMGLPNGSWAGGPGHGDSVDFRVNRLWLPGGVSIIVNAGVANAGAKYSLLMSASGRAFGQGPFFGLNSDALTNWTLLNNSQPWGALLDSEGSYRFDLPPGYFPPGLEVDMFAIIQDPATAALLARTLVIEFDS